MYLNDLAREGARKVDEEVVYSGLHETKVDEKKFKRTKKFASRYTKARSGKRKRKGRLG
jgi:hypothetical protein